MRAAALALVAMLAAAEASNPSVRCQLPAWPGHPALACDPKASSCCPGTKCAKDDQGGGFSCQDGLAASTSSDHAALASALAARAVQISSLVAVTISAAANDIARANRLLGTNKAVLTEQQIVARVATLSDDHQSTQPPFNWQQYTPPPQMRGGAGYGHGKDESKDDKKNNDKKKDDKKNDDKKNDDKKNDDKKESSKDKKEEKKDDKKKDDAKANAAPGGFDYSKYTRQDTPSKVATTTATSQTTTVQKEASPKVPVDQVVAKADEKSVVSKAEKPVAAAATTTIATKEDKAGVETSKVDAAAADAASAPGASDASPDDLLVQAAKALLDADAAMRLKAGAARDEALQKAHDLLEQALQIIDKAAGRSSAPTSASGFDWHSYMPSGWGSGYNTGDRSPGSLEGPCGVSNGHSFGDCKGDDMECLSGICQIKSTHAQTYAAKVVVAASQKADEAARMADLAAEGLRAASAQLILSAQSVSLLGQEQTTKEINKTLSYLPPSDSPTFGLLLIGSLVVLYFVWNRVAKRRSYSAIPSDGWGASGGA